jgi:hypothetical protein
MRRIRAEGIAARLYSRAHGRSWGSAADVLEAQKVALDVAPIWTTGHRKPLQRVGATDDLAAPDQRADDRRALPGVLAVDLRDRGAEALT